MRILELKIPPGLLLLSFIAFIWVISTALPRFNLSAFGHYILLFTFAGAGLFISLTGVNSFRKADTTVNPLEPQRASFLVRSGIYKYTRNPMYLGFVFILSGWAFFRGSFYSLAIVAVFIFYMNRYQIKPEERELESIFGEQYVRYKKDVPRWL
ncbi:MAG: isoprenylcysteine carboxylmethyltransferase family protein [Balneolaceae bacterium]|nr:isoprenylcysteine carboxylmethyltransferase family protein [Balneolaceae bacterium]